jgi:glycosyltransferase involved in cell wall biosynthesis
MISIIICTYNPEIRLIKRAIKSVLTQKTSLEYELIIVDNNSSNDFLSNSEIKKLIDDKTKIICENQQGLVFARITGVVNSKFEIIVFVDDDNELSSDYIDGLSLLFQKFPKVKIWGAGNINVDFIEGAENWVKKYMMDFYQKRQLTEDVFGNKEGWAHFYPVGSGMVIEKKAFQSYLNSYNSGQISATGRKGDSLASGEDSQIIWTVIKNGYFVGSSPLLKLVHIIPKKRTLFPYLKRLNLNLSYSFYRSFYEVFNKNLNEKEVVNCKSYFLLFIGALRAAKLNFYDVYKIYNIRKNWFDGYRMFLKQIK